jgi:hypothetical protein
MQSCRYAYHRIVIGSRGEPSGGVATTHATAQSLERYPFAAALAINASGWCMTVRAPAGADSGSILTLTMANVLGLMYYMTPNEILVFKRPPLSR